MARGGKRNGAGRPKGLSTKIAERQSDADVMLAKLGGDELWVWAYEQAKRKRDYRAVIEIGKYWTDRAKGKAAQVINLKQDAQIIIQ